MDEYLENGNVDQIDVLAGEDSAAEMGPDVVPSQDQQQEPAPVEVLEVISVDELLQRLSEEQEAAEEEEEEQDPVPEELLPEEEISDPVMNIFEYLSAEDGAGIKHYWNSTAINDYTVTETLLLLIFVLLFLRFVFEEVRRIL